MKRGRVSRVRDVGCSRGWGWFSSLYGLLGGGSGRVGELVQRSNSVGGPSGGQILRGTCWSEGFPRGEHVRGGLGQLAGDLDPGHLGAPWATEPDPGGLIVIDVDGVAGGVDGGFDQRPAQMFRSLPGETASPVAVTGLVDPRAQS